MVRSYLSVRDKRFLDAWSFRGGETVPARFSISDAAVLQYDWRKLEALASNHPQLFPNFRPGCLDPGKRARKPWQQIGTYKDSWGLQWRCLEEGMTGTVVTHPLKDAPKGLDAFQVPDASRENGWQKVDWEGEVLPGLKSDRKRFSFCSAELRHGFFFLTLVYLLGYEKIIYAMADRDEYLLKLIGIVEDFNREIISILQSGLPAVWFFPEDLGAQRGPLVTSRDFRTFLRPTYRRLVSQSKQQGALAYLHSDGDIRELAHEILSCGFDVVNIQDRVNTLDDIKELFCGRAAVDLDIDRQELTVHGSPKDIREWVREAVIKLRTQGGGLSLVYDLYPGIPMDNIASVMDSLEAAYRGELK